MLQMGQQKTIEYQELELKWARRKLANGLIGRRDAGLGEQWIFARFLGC